MPAPIDYGVQIADPTQSFLSAFQAGSSIQDTRLKQEQQTQQAAQQKLIQEGFTKLRGPNATAADYANLSMMLPKDQSEAVRKSFEMLSGERQNVALQQSGQVFSAFKSGKPEIAINLLNQQIEGKRTSGDETGAKFLETWRDVAKENPKATEDYFGFTISQMPGGKDVISSAISLSQEGRAAAEAPAGLRKKLADADAAESAAKSALAKANTAQEVENANRDLAKAQADKAKVDAQYAERVQLAGLEEKGWNVKDLKSKINDRSVRLGLEQQTTTANVAEKMATIQNQLNTIPADSRKLINEAATLAATSKQSANQMNDLAKRIEDLGGYGAASRLGEFAKKTIGAEGYETGLRQEYTRLRNQAGIKSLPPGPATDKDIALALKGFPEDTANSKSIASFLRGMAKLQEIDAASNNAKTDWLAQNNGALTRAGKTFIAGDYTVKPGETFNDFNARVVSDVSKRYRSPDQMAEDKRAETMAKIPTTGTPAAAPTVNVRAQADAILSGGR